MSASKQLSLVIIAGFTPSECGKIKDKLEKDKQIDVLEVHLSYHTSQTEYSESYCKQLAKLVCEKIYWLSKDKKISSERRNPNFYPHSLHLIYKKNNNSELLQKYFYPSCQCIPCTPERPLSPQDVASLVLHTIKTNKIHSNRLPQASKNKSTLLPFQNFQTKRTETLKNRTEKEAISDQPNIKNIFADIRSEKIEGTNKRGFKDARNLFFSPSTADHAGVSDKWHNGKESTFIKGKYRFGAPIIPGFHYDVQFSPNSSLERIQFFCEKSDGLQTTKQKYINIHPNDVIRGK
ncbi:hypothetical protein [Halodesulfovibrio sp.]|jgi:hypothetical protein|uniref:hypothetical protein n=1 Tax=Halodesulfovibrio sp. TaxID=1912772 RepID=UPI0025F0168A|nr:hypothetical protein [Halodesulfovibrio sp.]MCT4534694.1 hypothetical protein [Halodesulfovibrio sp.]